MIFYSGDFLSNAPYQVGQSPMCFRSCHLNFRECDSSATCSMIHCWTVAQKVFLNSTSFLQNIWSESLLQSWEGIETQGMRGLLMARSLGRTELTLPSWAASGLLTDTLVLGASATTECELPWSWQSLFPELCFSIGLTQTLPILPQSCRYCFNVNLAVVAFLCTQGPSGHHTALSCSQLPSPEWSRNLSMGWGCHRGLTSSEG